MDKRAFDAKKLTTNYIRALEKIGIHPEQILLYGSYALGKATEWSDIDIVVISKDFEHIDPIKRLELLSLATWHVDTRIEAIGFSPDEIAKHQNDSVLWDEITKHHQVLFEAA